MRGPPAAYVVPAWHRIPVRVFTSFVGLTINARILCGERTIVMRTSVSKAKATSAADIRPRAGSLRSPDVGVTQERADRAIGIIIEAIQEIASALDAASVAIMYYIPAKGAEPKEALHKLDCAKQHFARALHLIDEVKQPPASKNA
jgi:hypothetical protein